MTLLTAASLAGSRVGAQAAVASRSSMGDRSPLLTELGAPPAAPDHEQPEVLSRGPVHEAFAEPVSMDAQAGLTAPAEPPPNIDEVPPPDRPEGRQFVWIPGYWSWDADRNSYLWVSACWRVAPPNMSWVPGYWSRSPGGWEWVAGYWAPADSREIEYLPPPPAVDNLEPIAAAPYEDTIWVPPCMYWVRGQYVRRAGYWLAAQPNWVWEPSHYVATPRGYIFAAGHWDYAFEQRGVLFAPLYFPSPLYRRPGFIFSHSVVLDVGLLRLSLFAYPRYNHYFFGDYYDDAYLRIGIYPWFDSRRHHSWYDPVYEHERWRHKRNEPRWEEHRRNDYARRRSDIALRPARTFREQESRLSKLPEPQRRAHQVAQPMAVAVARRETPFTFERINKDEQQKISRQATSVRTFRDDRSRWESAASKQQTDPPLRERVTTATPPAERREPAQKPRERVTTVTPPIQRREPVQKPRERVTAVTPPARGARPAA